MTRLRATAASLSLLAIAALVGPALASASTAAGRSTAVEALIAPVSACPHQTDPQAAPALQVQAMRCLTNFARRGSGLEAIAATPQLSRAASHKADDILRCDEFSHEACGREFTYWMQRFGYLGESCWRAGENIAWGMAGLATVRWIFSAWMHSAGHRENILGSYTQIGIGLQVGGLEGNPNAHVWVEEFGSHHC